MVKGFGKKKKERMRVMNFLQDVTVVVTNAPNSLIMTRTKFAPMYPHVEKRQM